MLGFLLLTQATAIGDHTGRHTSDRSSYRLLVEKLSYRFHSPQRNDLVVFKAPPELEAQNLHDDLIKRVVGLPGDMVQIRKGRRLSTVRLLQNLM